MICRHTRRHRPFRVTDVLAEDHRRRQERRERQEQLVAVALVAERGHAAQAGQCQLALRLAVDREEPHARRRVLEIDRGDLAAQHGGALEDLVALGKELLPVRALRVAQVGREKAAARRILVAADVDAIVEQLDDVEVGVNPVDDGGGGRRRLARRVHVQQVDLALRPALVDLHHQPATVG
jgi:hypothetical protein